MRERARQLSLVSTHSLSARKRETPSKKCSPKRALSRRPFPSRESNSTASMSQAAVRGFSRGREASVETQRRERGQRRIIALASTAALFFFFFFFFLDLDLNLQQQQQKLSTQQQKNNRLHAPLRGPRRAQDEHRGVFNGVHEAERDRRRGARWSVFCLYLILVAPRTEKTLSLSRRSLSLSPSLSSAHFNPEI